MRSFAAAMRTISAVDLKPYFQSLYEIDDQCAGQLNWSALFGNERPVEIDIGAGRGLFVCSAAEMSPERNFVGIEIDFRSARRAAARLQKRSLPNARILAGDVKVAFSRMIEPASVDALHVYFPDPWWKKRHRSRRVFSVEFTHLAAKILKPGALLHSWSDVHEYFEVISDLMNHHEAFEPLPPPDEKEATHDMDYQTSFERKKRKIGCPIYRGRWRKKL